MQETGWCDDIISQQGEWLGIVPSSSSDLTIKAGENQRTLKGSNMLKRVFTG